MHGLWTVNVIDGPAVWALRILSVAFLVYLLVRPRGGPAWYLSAAIALFGGALLSLGTVWVLFGVLNVFRTPLISGVRPWALFTFAAVSLAVLSLLWRGGRWWRRLLSGVAVIVFLLTGAIGVNAAFGLQTTLGAVFHIGTNAPVHVIKPTATPTPEAKGALYTHWKPPADMPPSGQHGPLPAASSANTTRPTRISSQTMCCCHHGSGLPASATRAP